MPYIHKHDVHAEMNEKQNSVNSALIVEANEEDYLINTLIREKYSMSQETALHRKRLMGTLPEEEWDEYTTFIEECVAKSREAKNTEV